ncbi:DUF2207 domain-containing protein, partial [Patescibacteria group bacterium]|nr:DUF2207 domain-containing protein [Patescibacteria group bacterium]
KLYLQTAERHRVQNLTPDLFEKFLPYAMIYGIEKKWAKAFESLTMQPPNWYAGPTYTSFAGTGGGSSGFSASAFSSSFSTSFVSAFATSSGTGGSGGGGSAGGGGGGGAS